MSQRLTFRQEDDDDEDLGPKLYGTALPALEEDEVAPKKADIDLTVRDEKGRRRFHGAFTGGFSAGFFNTVGSKEGWVPSQFVSKRGSKRDADMSRPEDFMDEEDFNMFQGIAPKKVKTTDIFSSNPSMDFMGRLTVPSSSSKSDDPLSLVDFLKETVKPTKISIGIKLLKRMKATSKKLQQEKENAQRKKSSKPKESSAQKSYGCSLPPDLQFDFDLDSSSEEEEDLDIEVTYDSYKAPYEAKNNTHGLGYKGMLTPIASSATSSGPSLSASIAGKKLKITGNAFGTGVLEEEDGHDYMDGADNVYDTDDMSKYDFEMRAPVKDKQDKTVLAITDSGSHAISDMFEKEAGSSFRSAYSYLSRKYPLPKIPREWRPKSPYKSVASVKRHDSDSSSQSKKKSRWDDPDKKKRDHESSQTSSSFRSSGQNQHRAMDLNVRRVIMREGLPVKKEVVNVNPETEVKVEPRELTSEKQSAQEQPPLTRKPLSGFLASKFTSSSATLSTSVTDDNEVKLEAGLTLSSHLTITVNREKATATRMKEDMVDESLLGSKRRTTITWFPDKLLCKRFNLPVPSPGSGQGMPASFVSRGHHNSFNR